MKHSDTIPVIIRDDEFLRNIFIQLNLSKGTKSVFSNFSAWENLAFLLEALAVTIEQCTQEGIPRKKVFDEIEIYLSKIIDTYKIRKYVKE